MRVLGRAQSIVAIGFVAFVVATASAGTIATFADPALDGTTPLFSLSGTQFSGGWSGTNLNLLTPGWAGPDIPNAKFAMPPLTATPIGPGVWTLPAGQITFTDAANTPVLLITFGAASLSENIGFGASNLALQTVVFSVPSQPQLIFSQERFAFSFANDAAIPNGTSWTAAFTSSANVVPEPASVGLLAVGGLLTSLLRRRGA